MVVDGIRLQFPANKLSRDYTDILAQIGRTTAGDFTINPASYVLFLSALSELSFGWLASGVELTAAQLDNVEKWIAGAYVDLLSEVECEGVAVSADNWIYQVSQGTRGDTTSAGLHYVPFNTTAAANEENVVLTGTINFTPTPGLYYVYGKVSSHSQGRGVAILYNEEQDEFAIYGENVAADTPRSFAGIVEVIADDYFNLVVDNAESGVAGFENDFSGLPETYASITWLKL